MWTLSLFLKFHHWYQPFILDLVLVFEIKREAGYYYYHYV